MNARNRKAMAQRIGHHPWSRCHWQIDELEIVAKAKNRSFDTNYLLKGCKNGEILEVVIQYFPTRGVRCSIFQGWSRLK